MFATDDTIVAIATPPGPGGIGVVRVSGPASVAVARSILRRSTPLAARRATLTDAVAPDDGHPIDRVVATYFPQPGSYTGEDVIEISGHGSPVLLRQIVSAAVVAGARLAEPGEFTFRAYLNGRVDLVQAEAVADLVDAVTPLQARAAFDQLEGTITNAVGEIDRDVFDLVARLEASLDFPDEGYHFVDETSAGAEARELAGRLSRLLADAGRGRLLREGCEVAIVGKPNVGKSTLFNQLCGAPRAIVTDIPGTTRDLLTETIDVCGIPTTLVDTAGLRESRDSIEAEGVSRAQRTVDVADVVVVVLDRSRPLEAEDRAVLDATRKTRRLIVVSKCDLAGAWTADREPCVAGADPVIEACLLKDDDEDLDAVRQALVAVLEDADVRAKPGRDVPAVTNLRHIELLDRARTSLMRAGDSAQAGATEELVLTDLQEARVSLEEISGARTPDAVLERIFEQFCIGK